MNTQFFFILRFFLPVVFLLNAPSILANEKYVKIIEEKIPQIKKLIFTNEVVGAVISSNKKNSRLGKEKALEEIKKLDKRWINSVETASFMKPFLTNSCAKHIKMVQEKLGFAAEIFVMDNLGAVVCETDRTSDFYQGDEKKWSEPFNSKENKPLIDKPDFDESSQRFISQLSIPMNFSGKRIGVVTVGIDLDLLERSGK